LEIQPVNAPTPPRDQDPSRRQILQEAVLTATGTVFAPNLLFAASGSVESAPTDVGAAGKLLTLKASKFRAAPDGREREVWGYNGQVPGPTIRVKEGDTLRARVVNELSVPTSVHWHGMHQPGTWRMDGVDGVSSEPIAAGSEFTYEFRATPAGTHWYHSHVGVQYGNGLFGPLIVEEQTPIARYDRDEVMIVNDWFLEPGEALLNGILKAGAGKMARNMDKMDRPDPGDVPFQSGLVNGRGRASGNTRSPLAVVEVKKGETIRLRLVNASSTYGLRFQIDGHPLTVIATDGLPTKPVTVDNLPLAVGERYDVLLIANRDGVHWIRAVTATGNEVLAVLRYAGDSAGEPAAQPVRWGVRGLTAEQMRSPRAAQLTPKFRDIPLLLGGSMMPYRWSIDGQYFPKANPVEIQAGEVIRFLIRNPTGMDHPFHLHGHSFRVLGKPGALNLADPVLKDTVNVPSKSELVVQWSADNPGRWFFHCHIEWHLAAGMARILEIKPFN
jgi:FtsP/CotA-like multicopper oxidase with cupredoxin domain